MEGSNHQYAAAGIIRRSKGLVAVEMKPTFIRAIFVSISLSAGSLAHAEIINHQILIGARDLPILAVDGSARVVEGPFHGDVRLTGDVALYTPDLEQPGTDWVEIESDGIRHRIAIRVRQTFPEVHTSEDIGRGPIVAAGDLVLSVRRLADLPSSSSSGRAPHAQSAVAIGSQVVIASVGVRDDAALFLIGDDGDMRDRLSISALLADRLDLEVDVSSSMHGGLRGVAAHPAFASNGRLYLSVNTTAESDLPGPFLSPMAPDAAHVASLVELTVSPAAFLEGRFEVSGARVVFQFGMGTQNHGIRQIAFNPYLGVGDEGYGDLFVSVGDNRFNDGSQDELPVRAPFGSVLRLDPIESIRAGREADDLVFVRGLRNPHNLFFLPDGRLVIVDIGDDDFDEVNIARGGEDFGWPEREGPAQHIAGGGVRFTGEDHDFVEPAAFLSQPADEPDERRLLALSGGGAIQLPDSDFGILLANFTHGGEVFLVRGSDLAQTDADGRTGRVEQLTVGYDHDSRPDTTPWLTTSLTDLGDYLRSDARIHRLDDRRVLITMKSTTSVYVGELVTYGD
ncbi:PQQ-dependent sugar dehydrogenase [Gymnodinialimonas ceratoperidinii]|uniref:PQQ-dependent sugar dehydrogenase n=1 Tax=Gymnodinialimonas ceratoperidinii TaxID=2856823 RepID=A0A8F6TSG5_9RHOB|nr:PQQ-dependent sugar dehydrogenase [Gymnodinialimonas ceratoperidinii]QXT38141.1 PQQ-dependent sugar dehydrogenase [Gymnodinialimonas ceratoperidinii]